MQNVLDLSIIIINWNSSALLRKCLLSIYGNTKRVQYEILVVDNASFDGCCEMLTEEFPAVRFIQSRENGGFARANNLGFRSALGRMVLFLNPDTEIQGPAIDRMLQFLETTSDAGLVGARLLNSDLSTQTSCIQKFPTIVNQAVDAELLRRLFPKLSLWGIRQLIEAPASGAAVEVISGACQMIRREAFERVGMFDEKFFMYAEDVDLCYRMFASGRKNYYVGDATVIHHGGQSSGSSPQSNFSAVVLRESLYRFFEKHRGPACGNTYRITMALVANLRLMLLVCVFILSIGLYRKKTVLGAFRKWAAVLRWSLGLESWVHHLAPAVATDALDAGYRVV